MGFPEPRFEAAAGTPPASAIKSKPRVSIFLRGDKETEPLLTSRFSGKPASQG